jgi:hypothetical protein
VTLWPTKEKLGGLSEAAPNLAHGRRFNFMRLFHFSEDKTIDVFVPRPVAVPSRRRAGMEWLNGPLVWAIQETHDFLYHFPRECPRILVWAHATTAEADREQWLGCYRAAAYIERRWLPALSTSTLYRYDMPAETFEPLDDAGMWVSRTTVLPLEQAELIDLPATLMSRGVDLRVVNSLVPLKPLWGTTLHTSGIRLRNAAGWT